MKKLILLVSLAALVPLASCVYRPYPYYRGYYGDRYDGDRYYGGYHDRHRDQDRRDYPDRDDGYGRYDAW